MKRIIPFLLLIAAFSIFDACVTDSKSGDTDPATETGKAAARKPRTPKVTYRAFDSLVVIRITGSKAGEEGFYWIHRDGKLLEQPVHRTTDSGDLYTLVDSLSEIGEHTYNVQYGSYLDSLSDKSPDYVYRYEGHSRSGWVEAALTQEQLVRLTITPAADEVITKILVERKIGAAGKIGALDTVDAVPGSPVNYLDTALVAEDAYLYYRVRAMDAVTEAFLPASAWDSVQVKNKVWKYVPSVDVRVGETEVSVQVNNPLGYAGNVGAYYRLYRNSAGDKAGADLVDSLLILGYISPAILKDRPDSGSYYYWVEAIDPWGRTSARSTPRRATFTGRPVGPFIASVTVSQNGIQIQTQPQQNADAQLYILERTQDTAKAPTVVDTFSVFSSTYITFTDAPRKDGYYFYRMISVDRFDMASDPGAWKRSDYFHYDPVFGSLTYSILNRGDRVEARIDRSSGYFYVLIRSKSTAETDSGAVDTLRYADTSSTLKDTPPLGTWYYRVYRYPTTDLTAGAARTVPVRVEFTGKPVGATILSMSVSSALVEITIVPDPDALAYITERSRDGKDWTIADTISAQDFANYGRLRDRPPQDGYWTYRIRNVRQDLKATDPGPSQRMPTSFAYAPIYNSSLYAVVENKGADIECTTSPSYGYVTYLMRGTTSDASKGSKVDSLFYTSSLYLLKDTPAKGTYYYWVQQELTTSGSSGTINRSTPIKIDFTGAPEITSLTKPSTGIQINFPRLTATSPFSDSLEIYRSTGDPEDADSFTLIHSVPADGYATYYFDSLNGSASGFYHYRLALKRDGVTGDLGSAKSIYYEAGTGFN